MVSFYPFPTPDGQTFRLIALNVKSDPRNSFIQLYPKDLDLEVNRLFVETVLFESQAVAVVDPSARKFAREIQVKGDYILGALVTLFDQGYIDEETLSSIEARLAMAPLTQDEPVAAVEAAPLPPLSEKLEAFVQETQNRLPQEYVQQLFPLLLEYTSSMPLKEIIEMAKGYFSIAWVKTAISSLPEKVVTPEILEKLCPQSLQDYPELALQHNSLVVDRAVVQLERLADKDGATTHQQVLDELTQVAIMLNSHEGALPQDLQTRVEAASIKLAKLIPAFNFDNQEHLTIKADIEQVWNEMLMPKLGLNIPCVVEMDTDFDHELALLYGMQADQAYAEQLEQDQLQQEQLQAEQLQAEPGID